VQSERVVLQRKIALDQAEQKEALAAVPRIDRAIRDLARKRPANLSESVLLRKQAATLQAQRKKILVTIGRLEKSIPSMQAAIKLIGDVEALGSQLHNKARFHGRLCAVTGDREITLIELGSNLHQ
jgi:hypothetical protein